MKAQCVKRYEFDLDTTEQHELPSEKINELAWALHYQNRTIPYPRCVEMVLAERPELALAYSEQSGGAPRLYKEGATPDEDPAKEAHEMAMRLLDGGQCKNYSEAAARVLRENPRLNQRWASFASGGTSR